ncbi:MAG: hypothetical protein A2Y79_05285 [Deltaproteobacteria bacterium RBG_13_43_22]|nr:MAG: hypothetical protein A2Y79_05285 [Deltaproteobacteria bacterium RBG_13_43_22]
MKSNDNLIQDRIHYLRANTDFVSTIFDNLVGYAIVAADFDGNIIAYNEGAHQIFGLNPGEVIGKKLIEDFFPDEFKRSGGIEHINSELLEKGRFTFEGEMLRKDRSRFPAHAVFTLTRDKEGQIVGFVKIVQDLSKQKQAEELLNANEARFRLIIDSNATAMLIVDEEGIINFVNPAAENLFGRKKEELIGSSFGFPTVAGEKAEIDIVRSSDYGTAVAEMHITKLDWKGKPSYLASLFDITAIKAGSEASKRANEELLRLNTMKTQFISVASHELRTPLTSIKNAVDIIISKKAGELTANQERFLGMASRNINRVTAMINDLLDLTKLESKRTELHLSEVNVVIILQQLLETFNPQAAGKSVALELEYPKDLPTVYGDQQRVEQIFYNLVGNALKFTPEGGRVTVSARIAGAALEGVHDYLAQTKGSGSALSQWLELSVTDTGIGILPEDQKHIFEPFYQVEDNLMMAAKGTGLGLAITKELIEALGGKISVKSKRGQGSRFSFMLPAYSPHSVEVTALEKMALIHPNSPVFSLLEVNFVQEVMKSLNCQARDDVEQLHERIVGVIRKVVHRDGDRIIVKPISGGLVILLDKTTKEKAVIVRKKIEGAFSRHPFFFEGRSISVPTVSEPVAFPEDGVTLEELLSAVKKPKVDYEIPTEYPADGADATSK